MTAEPTNTADHDDASAPRPPAPNDRPTAAAAGEVGVAETQRLTASHIRGGDVPLPVSAKRLLPSERGFIEVMVRGHLLRARWDPRTERPGKWTGMLYFGFRKLEGLVSANEVLELHHEPDGALQLR